MDLNKLFVIGIVIGIVGGFFDAITTLIMSYQEITSFSVISMFTVGVLIKVLMFIVYTAISYPIIKFLFKKMDW